MSSLVIRCFCGTRYHLDPEPYDRHATCRKCGRVINIPAQQSPRIRDLAPPGEVSLQLATAGPAIASWAPPQEDWSRDTYHTDPMPAPPEAHFEQYEPPAPAEDFDYAPPPAPRLRRRPRKRRSSPLRVLLMSMVSLAVVGALVHFVLMPAMAPHMRSREKVRDVENWVIDALNDELIHNDKVERLNLSIDVIHWQPPQLFGGSQHEATFTGQVADFQSQAVVGDVNGVYDFESNELRATIEAREVTLQIRRVRKVQTAKR